MPRRTERITSVLQYSELSHVDKCTYGICSKFDRMLHRKSTFFLSNMPVINSMFNGKRCVGGRLHHRLEGSEG